MTNPVLKSCLVALAAAFLSLGAGCQTVYSSHQFGDQRIVARYGGRTLFAEIPDTVRVPAVIAAADEVFRGRGYSVNRSESTEENGMISASPPAKSSMQHVIVHADASDHGTAVHVAYEPFPDRELCESIFDAILAKLSTH